MSNAIDDQIGKQATLRAPRARVWRAISESQQFGRWFGARLPGPFVAGERMVGAIAPTEDREPTTLVEIVLADPPGGTRLTITESGFAALAAERCAAAFPANERGWTHRLKLVAGFVETDAHGAGA